MICFTCSGAFSNVATFVWESFVWTWLWNLFHFFFSCHSFVSLLCVCSHCFFTVSLFPFHFFPFLNSFTYFFFVLQPFFFYSKFFIFLIVASNRRLSCGYVRFVRERERLNTKKRIIIIIKWTTISSPSPLPPFFLPNFCGIFFLYTLLPARFKNVRSAAGVLFYSFLFLRASVA